MAGTANSGRRKDKPFRDAIMFALNKIEKLEDGTEQKRLDALAEATVKKALTGDVSAIKEIGDRVDGKPAQQIDLGNVEGEEFKTVTRIENVIIDAANPDGEDV